MPAGTKDDPWQRSMARARKSANISYGARIVDILVPSMLRLLAKPVAFPLVKPGS
jgi:hypothetical protein